MQMKLEEHTSFFLKAHTAAKEIETVFLEYQELHYATGQDAAGDMI